MKRLNRWGSQHPVQIAVLSALIIFAGDVAIQFNVGHEKFGAVHKVVLAAIYAIVFAGVVYLANRSKRQRSDKTLPPLR